MMKRESILPGLLLAFVLEGTINSATANPTMTYSLENAIRDVVQDGNFQSLLYVYSNGTEDIYRGLIKHQGYATLQAFNQDRMDFNKSLDESSEYPLLDRSPAHESLIIVLLDVSINFDKESELAAYFYTKIRNNKYHKVMFVIRCLFSTAFYQLSEKFHSMMVLNYPIIMFRSSNPFEVFTMNPIQNREFLKIADPYQPSNPTKLSAKKLFHASMPYLGIASRGFYVAVVIIDNIEAAREFLGREFNLQVNLSSKMELSLHVMEMDQWAYDLFQ